MWLKLTEIEVRGVGISRQAGEKRVTSLEAARKAEHKPLAQVFVGAVWHVGSGKIFGA